MRVFTVFNKLFSKKKFLNINSKNLKKKMYIINKDHFIDT